MKEKINCTHTPSSYLHKPKNSVSKITEVVDVMNGYYTVLYIVTVDNLTHCSLMLVFPLCYRYYPKPDKPQNLINLYI